MVKPLPDYGEDQPKASPGDRLAPLIDYRTPQTEPRGPRERSFAQGFALGCLYTPIAFFCCFVCINRFPDSHGPSIWPMVVSAAIFLGIPSLWSIFAKGRRGIAAGILLGTALLFLAVGACGAWIASGLRH